jgi:DNA-binding CsgD family transcriptional regulator
MRSPVVDGFIRRRSDDRSAERPAVRPSNDQFDAPAALVLVRDPEQATAKESLLRELFGFTAMEARLAETLSCGHSLNDFARANDVSANTVKTHLRGLFLKTNTKRQAELVSFLLRSVGAFDAR